MRFGLNFPNFGQFSDPSEMADLAVAAEKAGWDGFFVWDHIVIGDGVPVADPWVILAAIAARTERIRIGTLVTPVPRRRPWVLARQAVSVDHLSKGRLILGVGIGYPADEEFGTFGEEMDDRTRADMLDEGLEVINGIWSGKPFRFSGEHFSVAEKSFLPRPVQQPRIPIWVAGMWPNKRPFRRAARFDGVAPIRADLSEMPPDELREVIAYVKEHRQSNEPFDVVLTGPSDPALVAAYAEAGLTWYLVGALPDGDTIADAFRWIEAGPPRKAS